MARRLVAGFAIVVVVIVMILGIHSCQVSSRNDALNSYATSVASLIGKSDAGGASVFKLLTGASDKEQAAQQGLDTQKSYAQSYLQQAQNLSVPDQVTTAQQNFLLALSLRESGISDIDSNIQVALTKGTAEQGIEAIARDMQKFLASDVVYTTQTAPEIAAALHAAGIPVGGQNGLTIASTNFLPSSNLDWLVPSTIATELGASVSVSAGGGAPCPTGVICGHELNSVSVGGVALSTGGGNTITASPAPTFTANFTNTGQNTETNVVVKATVTTTSGADFSAQAVEPQTKPGQTYNLAIPLGRVPLTGQAQVTVTVERVPGETSVVRNTQTFPVTFD